MKRIRAGLLGRTSQKKITIRHDGRLWTNLTRWLPAIVIARGKSFVIEDDFSGIIEQLRRGGRRFIMRENSKKQRALFVEET